MIAGTRFSARVLIFKRDFWLSAHEFEFAVCGRTFHPDQSKKAPKYRDSAEPAKYIISSHSTRNAFSAPYYEAACAFSSKRKETLSNSADRG